MEKLLKVKQEIEISIQNYITLFREEKGIDIELEEITVNYSKKSIVRCKECLKFVDKYVHSQTVPNRSR